MQEVVRYAYPDIDKACEFLHLAQEGRDEGGLAGPHLAHHCHQAAIIDAQVDAASTWSIWLYWPLCYITIPQKLVANGQSAPQAVFQSVGSYIWQEWLVGKGRLNG